jgi:hypothetical protein
MKVGKNCHRIVKIVREYENDQQAIGDLTRLMVGEITEEQLVKEGGTKGDDVLKISLPQAIMIREWYVALQASNPMFLLNKDKTFFEELLNFCKGER